MGKLRQRKDLLLDFSLIAFFHISVELLMVSLEQKYTTKPCQYSLLQSPVNMYNKQKYHKNTVNKFYQQTRERLRKDVPVQGVPANLSNLGMKCGKS